MKPFLRWAGSKRKLIPELIQYWLPSYKRYIEPFMGSACLFFAIEPQHAILSDINEELVTAFIAIRDYPERVYAEIIAIPRSKESYYQIRSVDTTNMDMVRRAARFVFLNRFCFNGLYRTNRKGKFNVPFSPSGTGPFPTFEEFVCQSEILRKADIRVCDFEQVVKETKEGDFVYLDPPYAMSEKRTFTEYGPDIFSSSDLYRTKSALRTIDRNGAHFVMSYAYCDEIKTISSIWNSRKVILQRNIAGFAKYRVRAEEVIITNSPVFLRELPLKKAIFI